MAKISEIDIPELSFSEGAAPTTPGTNDWKLYFKTDGLYFIDDAGVETGPLAVAAGAGDDTTAIHDDTASEISAITAKSAVVAADYLLIEDSAASNAKKSITVQEIIDIIPAEFMVAASDESTAIDATGTKLTFRMPYAMTVSEVRASLNSACTTGTFTVDINEGGTTILSTKLTIDATEKTSTTAATAAVISDSALADDAEITIDVDDVGDSTAYGLKVTLIGTRT